MEALEAQLHCPCGFSAPEKGTVFYYDGKAYVCLAFHPTTKGHVVVVWKEHVNDIDDLPMVDRLHFMRVVFMAREAQLHVLGIDIKEENIYLALINEARHVHLHLVPRRKDDNMGFELLSQPHGKIAGADLSVIPALRSFMSA